MGEKKGKRSLVMVNRSLALTLWEAVAAEVLGFENGETLTPLAGICKVDCLLKGGKFIQIED
jgi:hypothetical protein